MHAWLGLDQDYKWPWAGALPELHFSLEIAMRMGLSGIVHNLAELP